MLLVIVGEFSRTMKTELNITRNFKEEEEAYQLAVAGFEQAKMEILSVSYNPYVYLDDDGAVTFYSTEGTSGDDDDDEKLVFNREVQLGSGRFKYSITDEKGKLNINIASVNQLRDIIRDTGVESTEADIVVDSIIDWRDANDLIMVNGAEEDYYRSLPEPYSSKDSRFDAVEELLLVRGVTPEIYYGSIAVGGEKEDQGIKDYLTVWGSNEINLSTSYFKVLEAVFGLVAANNIMIQRDEDLIPNLISGGIVTSNVFTIVSTGYNRDSSIKRSVKVIAQRTRQGLETLYWNDNYTG